MVRVISKATGIPITAMLKSERQKLLELESHLRQHVVGQEEAISAVSEAVRMGRAGFHDPKRPIASFMFLGPTGKQAERLVESRLIPEKAWERQNCARHSQSSCLILSSPLCASTCPNTWKSILSAG